MRMMLMVTKLRTKMKTFVEMLTVHLMGLLGPQIVVDAEIFVSFMSCCWFSFPHGFPQRGRTGFRRMDGRTEEPKDAVHWTDVASYRDARAGKSEVPF